MCVTSLTKEVRPQQIMSSPLDSNKTAQHSDRYLKHNTETANEHRQSCLPGICEVCAHQNHSKILLPTCKGADEAADQLALQAQMRDA